MGKGIAGLNTLLYTTGATTAVVDEACTEVSGTVFQVTETTRRIADDEVAVVVEADAVVQSGNYTFDYNTATITFTDGSHTGETVTVSYSYLPQLLLAKIRMTTMSFAYDVGDSTCQGDSAEDLTLLLHRATAEVDAVQLLDETLYGTTELDDQFFAKTRVVLDYKIGGASGRSIRCRMKAGQASISNNGASGLAGATMSWVGDVGDGTFATVVAA